MSFLVVVASVVVLLAGCSSPSGEEQDPVSGEVFTSTATLSNLPPPVPTSDTMYLLDQPHMAASPPSGPPARTPVPSQFDDAILLGTAAFAEWTLPRDGLQVLEGNLTFWVEVQGSVTNPNVPFFGGTACFWSVQLMAYRSEGGYDGVGNCADEPNVVPSGVREFRLEFSALDIKDVTGDTLAIRVSTSGIYSDGATVDLLSGSPEFPSRLALRGLTLPLDTQTYL